MTSPDDNRLFGDLFRDAVDHVEPGPGLDAIRARVSEEAPMNRRWIVPLSAAAAVLAVVGGVFALQGGDPTTSPDTPPITSPTQTDSPSPSPSPTPPGVQHKSVPVYYVGDTPAGPRLFREFQGYGCDPDCPDPLMIAVDRALLTTPDDPDYATLWPEGSKVVDGAAQPDLITVDLAPASLLHDRPAGMSEEEARIAVQQVIYTAQAAVGKGRLPVQLTLDGKLTDEVLGQPASEALANDPVLETLSHVNITSPAEGATITGDTLRVTGVANSFEATVSVALECENGGGTGVGGTAEGWEGDKLYPFTAEIPLRDRSGECTLIVETDDPSGGAEGNGPYRDTKVFQVKSADGASVAKASAEDVGYRFARFARGEVDSAPVDTPVELSLGGQHKRTLAASAADDRGEWEVCTEGYAERTCPFSAVTILSSYDGELVFQQGSVGDNVCVTGTELPGPLGDVVTITPADVDSCIDWFAVQLRVNDVGQVTDANLIQGAP